MTDYKFTIGTYPMRGGGTAEIVHVARDGRLHGYVNVSDLSGTTLHSWVASGRWLPPDDTDFDLLPPAPEQRECWVIDFATSRGTRHQAVEGTRHGMEHFVALLRRDGYAIHAIKHVTYTDGEGL